MTVRGLILMKRKKFSGVKCYETALYTVEKLFPGMGFNDEAKVNYCLILRYCQAIPTQQLPF